ncbi:MAG: hypothetical protein A3K59_06085 [Euryarchaeota archaeon RBG_19FT_COMBO_69_17]|nr:MAG: hypothetical protein A3K59_06085 [Euryarchaeota archaeon RBG_19FT_COMBO_69_17]
MIARIWRGTTDAARAEEYVRFLEGTGLREYRETPGNRGVFLLRRVQEGRAEFVTLTLWDSFEAIRRFAGPVPEKAVYYPKDREFLHELSPTVEHFEIVEGPWSL